VTLQKTLALDVSGWALLAPKTLATKELARKGGFYLLGGRVLLISLSKIDELEKHVQELRDVLDHSHPAATVPAHPTVGMREMPMVQMAPTAPMSYQGRPVQTPTFNSPREVSTVGSASFAPPSGTPRSIVQESPQTIIESPYTVTSQPIGERGGRPRAVRVRAIESTALSKEQIDVLFQM
jgi:hypothetical protein